MSHSDAGAPFPFSGSSGSGSALTSRPNDGTGFWPDFSNTGFAHAPGYNAAAGNCTHGYAGLTDYVGGMTSNTNLLVDAAANTVFNFTHFRGTVLIGSIQGDNFTFNGCVFDNGGNPGSAAFSTQTYLPTLCTWNYCTFRPSAAGLPPGNNGTISTAHTSPGTLCANSWQATNVNGNGGTQTGDLAIIRRYCDIWGNAGQQDISGGKVGQHVIIDHCYIHDQADTDSSGGCGYHHDGIGPEAPSSYIDITNSTLASLGNTNGIAFQTGQVSHCLISGNYLTGWGYTVNLGGSANTTDVDVTFHNNVFSCELSPLFGPFFGNFAWSQASNGPWQGNKYQFFNGDPVFNSSYNGQFWWPSDGNPHAGDYAG